MEYSSVQLNDLPDEILMIIFKKLHRVDVLHSLIGVNKRLNKIVHDSIFTNRLTLARCLLNDSVYPLPGSMLDRFCLQILPEIHHKIKWLDLEISSMKRILLSASYPNLFGLSIYNIANVTALNLFTDDTSFIHIFKNQISALVIGTITKESSSIDVNTLIFTDIFTMFPNLRYLNFNSFFLGHQYMTFRISPPAVFSSILQELYIKVMSIDDCLYLLDGRFNQLRTFYVDIESAYTCSTLSLNKKDLPNLRCFSLSCLQELHFYDRIIIPLLHRMLNLEKLGLYFAVLAANEFIDGNALKKHITNYMPRLNKFLFNIRSIIFRENPSSLLSNEDIQYSFKDYQKNKIISSVNYFLARKEGQCHVYTYPFTMKRYEKITNSFSGGLFTYVSEISLYDEHPFEHEFFIRIAQSFPLLKKLQLYNGKPQKNKQCRKSKDDNQELSIIKYPHLTNLTLLGSVHDDYVEQFLLDTKMCLPYHVDLKIDYKTLKRVTHNFTRDATRINCAKVKYICVDRFFRFPRHLKDYFFDAESIFLDAEDTYFDSFQLLFQ